MASLKYGETKERFAGLKTCLAEREGFEPPIPVKVCPLSRRIVSTTHAPLRNKSRLATASEKRLQQLSTTAAQDARRHFHAVVQAGMIQDLHHRTDGARFRVIRAVNQAFQPSMDQSTGTHGARLNCSKQFAALQAVVADGGTRFAQRDDLGVGSGVSVAEIAVTS